MKHMKKTGLLSSLLLVSVLSTGAYAIPTLQLDIGSGTYDHTTDTITAQGNVFTLYAYLIPDRYNMLTDTYFVSAAVSPRISEGLSIGSFDFNGDTIRVTEDMTYGVPPLENIAELQGWDKGDLPKHSIFPTYFYEFEFSFSSSNQISQYNTQDRAISGAPIDLDPNSSGGMYYTAFTVNTSNILSDDYVIHFDLYNTKLVRGGDIDVSQFAPFSHDAESTISRVPEPGSLLLVGSGLVGLYLRGRFSRKKLQQ